MKTRNNFQLWGLALYWLSIETVHISFQLKSRYLLCTCVYVKSNLHAERFAQKILRGRDLKWQRAIIIESIFFAQIFMVASAFF